MPISVLVLIFWLEISSEHPQTIIYCVNFSAFVDFQNDSLPKLQDFVHRTLFLSGHCCGHPVSSGSWGDSRVKSALFSQGVNCSFCKALLFFFVLFCSLVEDASSILVYDFPPMWDLVLTFTFLPINTNSMDECVKFFLLRLFFAGNSDFLSCSPAPRYVLLPLWQGCGHTGLSLCFHTESVISLFGKVSSSLRPTQLSVQTLVGRWENLAGIWYFCLFCFCLMRLLGLLCSLCFPVGVCLWCMHLCVSRSVFSCVCPCTDQAGVGVLIIALHLVFWDSSPFWIRRGSWNGEHRFQWAALKWNEQQWNGGHVNSGWCWLSSHFSHWAMVPSQQHCSHVILSAPPSDPKNILENR